MTPYAVKCVFTVIALRFLKRFKICLVYGMIGIVFVARRDAKDLLAPNGTRTLAQDRPDFKKSSSKDWPRAAAAAGPALPVFTRCSLPAG